MGRVKPIASGRQRLRREVVAGAVDEKDELVGVRDEPALTSLWAGRQRYRLNDVGASGLPAIARPLAVPEEVEPIEEALAARGDAYVVCEIAVVVRGLLLAGNWLSPRISPGTQVCTKPTFRLS